MAFSSSAYYAEWDIIIQDWMASPSSISPLFCNRKKLSVDYLPEPYYGDMDDCSIVMINLNPGTGLPSQQWSNQNHVGTEVYEAKDKGYGAYARPFHYLDDPYPYQGVVAASWWTSRKAWMDRILGNLPCVSEKSKKKRPFAIELCPFHSPKFGISNPNGYVSQFGAHNPKIDVIEAIYYAIRHSDSKLGLAVGRPIYEALVASGFLCISSTTVGKTRQYKLVENQGVRILCTWAQGSNKAPAAIWARDEKKILSAICH